MSRRVDDNRSETRRAEELMRRAVGLTDDTYPHPNPRVGAIVLSANGTVVAERAHAGPGQHHAELMALTDAGERAAGGTLVVTLEPCSHHGRTPPCVDAIVRANVATVIIGVEDPDLRVSGSGMSQLREAGITVIEGVLPDVVRGADAGYFHHRITGFPRLTLKMATTIDGQAAAADRTSQWITGDEARLDAHRLRARSDAIVIGAGTLRTDNPRLDVRIDSYTGPQPRPVIVGGGRPLPAAAAVYGRNPLLFSPDGAEPPEGIRDVIVVPGPDGVDLETMMKHLGTMGFVEVLVEGGPSLAGSLVRQRLVDEFVVYVGAKLGGGVGVPAIGGVFETIDAAIDVQINAITPIGSDIRIDATPQEVR
ncbi:MAG: bifunctional diaminohydroxyphosphoribosylaminopyrimidine deaminase/5-amino-6-(5-phosphoribosylamino)uracil reductase RibD [Acidimicrobiia bacterium]|nr:MAG: bifunctional diaminohydroxyphosphoribosylaminopyrimidine deaminase/5-amino-6-(5-phosphoribosylamino)uracil reductase RibD [Acidimicrobiia bacterium]